MTTPFLRIRSTMSTITFRITAAISLTGTIEIFIVGDPTAAVFGPSIAAEKQKKQKTVFHIIH